jgi:hypothetical protein
MMELLTKFSGSETKIDFTKTIKFKDIQEVVDSYLETVDLALDKIKVKSSIISD